MGLAEDVSGQGPRREGEIASNVGKKWSKMILRGREEGEEIW